MKDIDITKHNLVPKHEILNEKEKEELFKKFGITIKHLPRILESDPMVKILNGKMGDIVKITRKSRTALECAYYRLVVKA